MKTLSFQIVADDVVLISTDIKALPNLEIEPHQYWEAVEAHQDFLRTTTMQELVELMDEKLGGDKHVF